MVDEEFISKRLTELRIKKDVSEYQMSLDLGHSRSYIQSISSGRVMPSMKEFLAICEYLDITPMQFFDEDTKNPLLVQRAIQGLAGLSDNDLLMLIGLIDRMKEYMAVELNPCKFNDILKNFYIAPIGNNNYVSLPVKKPAALPIG